MSREPFASGPSSPAIDRRRFFLIGAAGAAALGAGLGLVTEAESTPHPAARHGMAAPGTAAARSRYLQIVAHEDDDLLFMTPDLTDSLRAGSAHLTVYLSAGESKAGIPPDTHDVDAYTDERETGARTAYALMLGVPNRWHRKTLTIGRVRVESFTLAGRPDVRLAFLRLPDGRDPRASLSWHTLSKLWSDLNGPALCGWTQAPQDSPYRQCLSREDVLATLLGLAESFRPTVVRFQDTAPDARYAADHPDHIAAAHFAAETVRRYAARHPDRMVLQVNYRDYGIRNLAVNLGDAEHRLKQQIFSAYAAHDYRISYENPHWDAYEARMVYRWPRGTGYATADAVFAVAAGRLVAWRRSGGSWSGPRSLGDPGGPLAPAVFAAGSAVLGLRSDNGEVVVRDERGWRSLGHPDPADVPNQPGTPVAAIDGSGMLTVFVRNGRGGVSARVTTDQAWRHGWADLPGVDLEQVVPPAKNPHGPSRYGDVQDGLAVIVTGDGLIELFAATRSQVLWWRQRRPGAPPAFAGTLPVAGAIAPLAADVRAGRVRVLFREQWTGRVLGVSRPVSASTWEAPAPVPAAAGFDGEPPVLDPLPRSAGQLIGPPVRLPGGSTLCAVGADGRLHVASRSGRARMAWRAVGRR